jgi:hypothetical protein
MTGYDWRDPDSPSRHLRDVWTEIVQAHGVETTYSHQPFDDIQAALRQQGAELTEWTVGQRAETRTVRQELDAVERRIWSSTWKVPDAIFPACVARLKAWAMRQYGSEGYAFPVRKKFIWQRFRWDVR